MITLPKNITTKSFNVGKNIVRRCYGQDEILLDNSNTANIRSRNPFIVEQDGKRVLLTSNPADAIPEDCAYAILVNKKPTTPLYRDNALKILWWLKHPAINDNLSPDEVAKTWRGKFTFIEEDKETGTGGLRIPQAGAIHAWLSTQHTRKDRATIVMPTGTGKTETMLGIMIAAQCKKILVTVPHDALREQISNKFLSLGKLHEFGIVTQDCKNPYVAVINNGMESLDEWRQIIEHSNVIVTTMALLVKVNDEVKRLLSDAVSHIFVDEAHHVEAATWSTFFDGFERTKITQFTATPFRNDGKKLKGDFVYTFSLRSAQQQGYYQKINFKPVYEIEKDKADEAIARQAVDILRNDIEVNHK
ncbi:MAG: DEAD/DEAH box helicase family protein, partial [Bacteroidales bacterium]|nr:DEAD/DEAH box helicase family protein [Bacteroidales bacterium]